MEKEAHYFLTGLFVSIALVAMIGFIIWIAGSHDARNYKRYTVYFTDSVGGLNDGATVRYKGVSIGNVLSVRLEPGSKELIKADIEIDENTPIRSKTQATLAMQGITGLLYIDLQTEPSDTLAPPILEGERYPVIQGTGTQISKLFEDIPLITKQILEVSTKINEFMDSDNMENLQQTLANIENMSRDLNGLLTPENVGNATATLRSVSQSSGNIQQMVLEFEKTADALEETVSSLRDVIVKNEAHVNKFTGEGLEQITAASRETRKTAESIRKLADQLSKNPSQILYQPSRNGVEIPQ